MNPARRRIIGRLLTSSFVVGFLSAFGFRYHRTRTTVRCSLPQHNYEPALKNAPLIKTLVSRPFIVLAGTEPRAVTATTDAPTVWFDPEIPVYRGAVVKLAQFAEPGIAIDHCSISNVQLMIDSNGMWSLSFRADQNPRPDAMTAGLNSPGIDSFTGRQPPEKFTLDLRRNTFFVQLRGLSANGAVLFELTPAELIVERAEPRFMRYTSRCKCDDVRQFFTVVDRVELQFHYE
jgi:hypothetical protein